MDNLTEVDIESFRHATRSISFDIYLKVSEDNVAHVFSKTTGLDYRRLAVYISKGVKKLYIRKEDWPAYEEFISRSAHSIFSDPNTPSELKIATLLNMTEQNMAELFQQVAVPQETVESSQRVIRSYVDLMAKNPQSLAIILRLISHGEYLYYHSIAVAIFSMLAAKATGQFDSKMLEIVGLGGFLHDIGCTRIPKEIFGNWNELSEEHQKEMKDHPKQGMEMISETPNLPDEVRYIVYQHHEQPFGQGYPNGIQDAAIYYPAKIVAVADAFSNLISKRPYRPAFSVEEALQALKKEPGRFDPEIVKIISSIFLRQSSNKNRAA